VTALAAIASTARTHCNLTHCILTYCNLTHCTLTVTTLTHCNLIHCALTCMLHSYYRHPPTLAPLTAPPSLCSHLMRSQEGRGGRRARYQCDSHSPVRSRSTQLRQNQKSERSCQCEKENKKTGEGVTRHDGNATQLTGRRRCSVRRTISHQLLPAHVIRCSRPLDRPRRCVYITQVRKRKQRTRRRAHTWFFTALPYLSPFLIFLYMYCAAFVLICLLATSSHLPPTSQLVQPAET
jgi:hypothetical protein